MSNTQKPSALFRSLAIILMALTVLFTLMGGIGTTCVAFGAEKYDSMKGLVPYKPLYQALVFISIAAGIWGVVIIVKLVRGGNKLYLHAIIMLIIGTVTSGIQTAVSQSVRGSSAPVNIRFYITTFTLIIYLLFRIPAIWERIQFDKSMKDRSNKTATGASLIVCGIIMLTTYYWTGSTHFVDWIDIIQIPLIGGGVSMLLSGIILILRLHVSSHSKHNFVHTSPNPV